MSNLKDFLGHKTRESERSNYLRWRKEGSIKVVLHRTSNITALWQHSLPRIQVLNKDGHDSKEVWGGTWNCIEPEVVLRKQYFRDRETGERQVPPTVCPMCILSEVLREAVKVGEIGLCDPIFKWSGDDPSKSRIITAGGFYNAYSSKKLGPAEKALMRKAGIKQSEGWKENTSAKCNYLFVVVDTNKPEDGIQLAIENTMLGQKMQECIVDRMADLGEEDGDPLIHPVVFEWVYRPNENDPSKKYKVRALSTAEISDEVEELINSDAPDVGHIIGKGNVKKLRKELEARSLVDLPWDDIFGPAEKVFGITHDADTDDESHSSTEIPDLDEPIDELGDDEDADDSADEDDVTMYDCDVCGAAEVMGDDDTECPECGATYDDEGEVLTHPGYDFDEANETYVKAKPKRKKRSSKKKAASKKKKAASKKKVSAKAKPEPESLDDIFDGDDIPFA